MIDKVKLGDLVEFNEGEDTGVVVEMLAGNSYKVKWSGGGVTTEINGVSDDQITLLNANKKQEKTLGDYINAIQKKYPEGTAEPTKYKHYFKDVSNVNSIDIYKVLTLWNVTHPCLQHAAKKILVAGNRGYKDTLKDIQEAIDSLERWKDMQVEDSAFNNK